jgi:ABC-type sugar transport system ATPase subunit
VFRVCDRITVLRDGRRIALVNSEEIDHHGLVRLILGRDLDELYSEPPPPREDVVLRIGRLAGASVKEFSVNVAVGEIVGIAGLVGSGRSDLLSLIFGSLAERSGRVEVAGKLVVPGSPRSAIRSGLALVPADRVGEGIISRHTLAHNLTLPFLRPLVRHGFLDSRKEEQEARHWIERVDIRPRAPNAEIDHLSGGNQQKALIARWLRTQPKVLLLDQPTRGVDIGAKALIYRLIVAAAAGGTAVLIASEDAEELAAICDRVLVMTDGYISAEVTGADLSEEALVDASWRPMKAKI